MTTGPMDSLPDVPAIVATVRDYFEGWFDADEERMARALRSSNSGPAYGS